MGYGLIALVASVALAAAYVAATPARLWSKFAVAIVVVASLVIWHYYPRWSAVATVLQAGAAIYVLVYFRMLGASRGIP